MLESILPSIDGDVWYQIYGSQLEPRFGSTARQSDRVAIYKFRRFLAFCSIHQLTGLHCFKFENAL